MDDPEASLDEYNIRPAVNTANRMAALRDNVLERKQREGVAQLDAILTDPLWAHEALELMSSGENTNVLKEMPMRGCKPDEEPSLTMMLLTFRASNPLELRTRTRIFVQNGRAVIGCLDETGTLE
ncbi:hypothetical protein KPL71_025211 [Citrus sinensis]|uniref:Uncharacterized protein n=1 Tax=Citrus sinensis TaxID=2711 RepID=A0ACB8HRJ4_CITSI|nr:hypothetical protein KPL71_025211 [Citrus sinensis]